MNAIVAMCHFCEQHGPSVVMCTQPHRYQERSVKASPSLRDVFNFSNDCPNGNDRSQTASAHQPDWPALLLDPDSVPRHWRNVSPCFVGPSTCRACIFPSRDDGMASHDKVANTSYISTQWPREKDLFDYLQTACHRSLSSEISPGPNGSFYFGDETNGHVMSYNFRVKDAYARGLQSSFSFLVLCWDRMSLLTLYPMLVSNFAAMASRVQQAAARVYEADCAGSSTVTGPGGTRYPMARSTSRGNTPPYHFTTAGSATVNIPGRMMMHQRRAVDADMRSLADLTNDPEIFYRIHAWFTWLLRAAGRRWTPVVSFTAPINEDTVVTQEEVVHLTEAAPPSEQQQQQQQPGAGLSATSTLSAAAAVPSMNPTLVGRSLGLTNGSTVEENALHLMTLTRLLHSLGVEQFATVLHHVIVGNQLVVQPLHDNRLGALVLGAFAKLLPKGCTRQVALSTVYLAPFRCNLLSLASSVTVPKDQRDSNASDVVFLAVFQRSRPDATEKPVTTGGTGSTATPQDSDRTGTAVAAPTTVMTRKQVVDDFVQSLHFRLCTDLPSLDSGLVAEAAVVGGNDNVGIPVASSKRGTTAAAGDSSAFARALAMATGHHHQHNSAGIKLVSKSTLVQQVVRLLCQRPPLPVSTLDLALAELRQDWISRASLLFCFKRCQGALLQKEEIAQRWAGVLAAIDCTLPENAAVVRFWQGALSQHSRQNTCHTRRRQTSSSSSSTSRRGSCGSIGADVAAAIEASNLCNLTDSNNNNMSAIG